MAPTTGDSRRHPIFGCRLRLDATGEGVDAPHIVELQGELDLDTVPEVDRFLRRRLGPLYHRQHIVMDLAGTTFVDSSFIGFLVRLAADLQLRRKELVLVRPMGQVRRVLGVVGLPNVVPVFESTDEAVFALGRGPLPLIPPVFSAARS